MRRLITKRTSSDIGKTVLGIVGGIIYLTMIPLTIAYWWTGRPMGLGFMLVAIPAFLAASTDCLKWPLGRN